MCVCNSRNSGVSQVPRFFQLSHDHIQAAVEDLQGGRPHSLSGQPVTHHPHSTEVLPDIHMETLVKNDLWPKTFNPHWHIPLSPLVHVLPSSPRV